MIRKNWLVVPLIIIGFYYNFWRIQNSDNEMMFQEFFYGCILLIFFIFLSFSFNKDFKKFKITRSWKSYLPSIIGVFILISFGVSALILLWRDSSPVIIYASYNGDFNGGWFEFRKDGTYKFVDHALGTADIYRGNYQIIDSIIYLDKGKIGNVIVSNKLAIREENHIDSTKVKVLYQINEKHSVMSNLKFLIIDNFK